MASEKVQFMTTFIIKKQAKWYWFYPCHFYVNSCTNFGSHKLRLHWSNFYESMFGFVTKIELILQGYFSCRWAVLKENWGIFCLFCHSTGEGAGGGTRNWKGIWPVQLTLTDQRDIPHHITFLFSSKSWGKDEEGCSELRCLYSQATITFDGAWLFWTVHDWAPACPLSN